MDPKFWHQRWKLNEIPFHEKKANPLLVKHSKALSLNEGSRVFLPLCGKTLDIHWLLAQGYRVAGAELSPIAIQQLFAELGVTPNISKAGPSERWSAESIDIFVGDFFNLSREMLGPIDAVYDRAALVALPEPMRRRYAAHLMEITDKAPQLVIVFEYDQKLQEGPPFSISHQELKNLYGKSYELTFLEGVDVTGGLKGKCPSKENVWVLK